VVFKHADLLTIVILKHKYYVMVLNTTLCGLEFLIKFVDFYNFENSFIEFRLAVPNL